MAEQGLLIKEVYVGEDLSKVVTVDKIRLFDMASADEYKNKFIAAKTFRKIDGEFEDNMWTVHEFNGTANLKFDIEINKNINMALKCFSVLFLYDKNGDASQIRSRINRTKKVLLMTNFLNTDNIDDLEVYFEGISDNTKHLISSVLLQFIAFFGFENVVEYKECFNKHKNRVENHRQLPNYKSIINFDFIINDYMRNGSSKEKERFFPLLLWWTITRVIPMRPIEFSTLKKGCAYYNKDVKAYYLTIQRSKEQGKVENRYKIPKVDDIRITKDIYNLVSEYQELIKGNESEVISYRISLI